MFVGKCGEGMKELRCFVGLIDSRSGGGLYCWSVGLFLGVNKHLQ